MRQESKYGAQARTLDLGWSRRRGWLQNPIRQQPSALLASSLPVCRTRRFSRGGSWSRQPSAASGG